MSNALALQPQSMQEAMQMSEMLSSSAMVPQAYKGRPADTLVAMMMGNELGLNPIQSLQNIAVINGKPSIYGDALTALIQNHPRYGGMEESFDEEAMKASCTVWRKGGPKHTVTFSQQDAKTAGLWGRKGPWTQYPKRMLQMRARGFAVRDQFSDALAGLITREEAEDMPVERDITPVPDPAPVIEQDPARVELEAQITTTANEKNIAIDDLCRIAGVKGIDEIATERLPRMLDYLKQQDSVEVAA